MAHSDRGDGGEGGSDGETQMDPRHEALALDLLVFRAGDNRFGLDAAQIGEVVRLQELELQTGDSGPARGVYRDGREILVVEMTAVVGVTGSIPRGSAKVVLHASGGTEIGFVVGEPEEMARVDVEGIEPLPPLLRPMVRGSGMWGLARLDGGLVILIDLAEAATGIAAHG